MRLDPEITVYEQKGEALTALRTFNSSPGYLPFEDSVKYLNKLIKEAKAK